MSSVKPIPDGFHAITPHLIIKGAGNAIEFYKKAFGAEELCRMPGPDGESVMHAEITIGGSVVMLADEFPDWNCLGPQSIGGTPVCIHLYVEDADATFKQAVDAGATPTMPVDTMFWGDRYGKVTDPFGHEWSIATHVEDVSEQDMQKRMAEQFGGCAPA